MRPAFRLLLLLNMICFGVAALSGCTNDTSSSAGLVTRAVTFRIQWGATPSLDQTGPAGVLTAPSQARSASLKLLQANPDLSDLTFSAERDLTPATLNQTPPQNYQVPSAVRVGSLVLVATFYEKPDPTAPGNTPIGMLTTTHTVMANTSNTIVINTINPPASIVIAKNQSVLANGKPNALMFTPFNMDGEPAPLNLLSDAVNIAVTAGNGYLSVDSNNMILGLSSGVATVVVTVTTTTASGKVPLSSTPELVTVNPNIVVSIDPPPGPIPVKIGTYQFTAHVTTVDKTPPSKTNVTWSVQGGSLGTIDLNSGLYTAPATAGKYTVIATSQADTGQTATAAITVEGGSGNVIIQ